MKIVCSSYFTFGIFLIRKFYNMAPLSKWLLADKLSNLSKSIQLYGGIKNTILAIFRYDDVKFGKLVGVDKFGNKYYENNYYIIGKNRWVIYSDKVGYDYDGSQIPAEWHGWLHYTTDLLPHEDKSRPNYKWMADHTENLSGTPQEYVPYSTTKRKIEPWVPSKLKK